MPLRGYLAGVVELLAPTDVTLQCCLVVIGLSNKIAFILVNLINVENRTL